MTTPGVGDMRGLGFSLKAMLLATATVGLAVAGMLQASLWWGAICLSFFLAMLTFGLLGAAFRRGTLRTFWIGFAIVGWTYAAIHFAPGLDRSIGHRLITTRVLAKVRPLFGKVYIPAYPSPMPAHDIALHEMSDEMFYTTDGAKMRPPQWDSFQLAGHMLFGIWLAGLGGLIGTWMAARQPIDSQALRT